MIAAGGHGDFELHARVDNVAAIAFYEAAGARRANVVVPPIKTSSVSRRRPRSGARDRVGAA